MNRNPNSIDVHVGAQVRNLRRLRHISQEELARSLGLTFQQVQKYERGTNRISASKLYEISQKLGEPVSFFFAGLPSVDGTEEFKNFEQQAVNAAIAVPAMLEVIKLDSKHRALVTGLIESIIK